MTDNRDDRSEGSVFTATKRGMDVRLSRDPHPGTDGYLVVEAPGLLVLFQNDRSHSQSKMAPLHTQASERDHDAQLRVAFQTPSLIATGALPASRHTQRTRQTGTRVAKRKTRAAPVRR